MEQSMEQWVKEIWGKLDTKLSRTAVSSFDKIPYTTEGGVHDNMLEKSPSWWTNGFWPALMILMYAGTGKEQYLKTARNAMKSLDRALFTFDGLHHDVGFMWNISAGVDYRLTGDAEERNRMLVAANHLMGRYNSNGEYFVAWNGEDIEGLAIIDCMMNIPLLFRATEETGNKRFAYAAQKHADKTMKFHVRPDGSCNHINRYDVETGDFIETLGGQGYCTGSSWTRGQAWGLYGFALAYRYTKNTDYLDTAKRIAHYFLAAEEAFDFITPCDFRQPKEPKLYDSTAAACATCGLLEIADLVEEPQKEMYRQAALRLLEATEKAFCNWEENEDAILLKGTGSYEREHHIPIIYGDYFFAEAIYRLMGLDTSILW